MISVGIDISKEKSTVCILKPYGEIILSPSEILHTDPQLSKLVHFIRGLNEEVRIIMEATGAYHLPVLTFLLNEEFFISVINPLVMKKYSNSGLRKGKTDKLDSIKIANYGLDNWYHLVKYKKSDPIYQQLQLLGRQYAHYMTLRINSKLALTNLLDHTMPGIKPLLKSSLNVNFKDKLNDFVATFWHFDNITKKSEKQFINVYNSWAKKMGYQQSDKKALQIYRLALESIPTLPSDTPSTKMLVLEAVRVLKEIDKTLSMILTQMQELAKTLNEYEIVRAMDGVGDVLAPRLIAEIGNIQRFHSASALIAYAGIDAPPFQSGQFVGTHRKISKRGSATLRKTGYEVMKCLKTIKPENNSVYQYIIKKEAEGKPKKVAKIAGLNKFLRIYYARVKEAYQN